MGFPSSPNIPAFIANATCRASAGRAFRVPTFTELYYRDPNHQGRGELGETFRQDRHAVLAPGRAPLDDRGVRIVAGVGHPGRREQVVGHELLVALPADLLDDRAEQHRDDGQAVEGDGHDRRDARLVHLEREHDQIELQPRDRRDVRVIREIEALYVDMIRSAKRFVYAENQYFASRIVAKAIAERLQEPDPPEFVIVNPHSADGWLEDKVMSTARAELLDVVRKCDRHGRFRIFYPVTEGREDIYVHSKITIVDDRLLRVGSANLNNRSMGLDSECDLLICRNCCCSIQFTM